MIGHHLQPTCRLKGVDCFCEIISIRPGYHCQPQRSDLHHIRTAHRHERSANENSVGQAIESPKITHSITQYHGATIVSRHCLSALLDLAVTQHAVAPRFDQPRDFVEPFWFAWHDNETKVPQLRLLPKLSETIEYNFLFTGPALTGHP